VVDEERQGEDADAYARVKPKAALLAAKGCACRRGSRDFLDLRHRTYGGPSGANAATLTSKEKVKRARRPRPFESGARWCEPVVQLRRGLSHRIRNLRQGHHRDRAINPPNHESPAVTLKPGVIAQEVVLPATAWAVDARRWANGRQRCCCAEREAHGAERRCC